MCQNFHERNGVGSEVALVNDIVRAIFTDRTMAYKPRILIVDDEDDVRHLIRLNFERERFQVEEASDGLRALELISSTGFDAIILDVAMPELDGFSVLQRLPESYLETTPVLLLTGFSGEEFEQEALEAGAAGMVGKPCNMAELVDRVKCLFEKSKGSSSRDSVNSVIIKSVPVPATRETDLVS